MLTEEQAKTKWCPLLRMIPSTQDHHALNMRGDVLSEPVPSSCIGSACMAWRWNGDSPPFPGAGPEDELDYQSRKGFCGAFGKDGV